MSEVRRSFSHVTFTSALPAGSPPEESATST
eukprot:CAMPEP_0181278262 /NCGR_PEP_ID=MMETSP1097-20121128/11621_1 /TAXON_ID=35684 /ORGANISM="Pseudopedinella elastica, Strain CCMP716" /LENGTH=30 /DNA_ID= /DNA_START= /DNA_END= /DNA_ORIENTATION=